ncbi:MAG: hypothetical protein OHK0013_46040 [Sandaracinaceae bacterium]
MSEPKKKIVILGSGAGSMAAAWGLTSVVGWQDRYEIDVYQMGWRCGGKGAAGRNRKLGDRIEEHGLHMWFGFYQNAFAMMREAYDELARLDPSYAYRSWRDAFTPRSDLFLEEFVGGRWQCWHTTFPDNREVPGDGAPVQRIGSFVRQAIEWGIELLLGSDALSWLEHHFAPFEPSDRSREVTASLSDAMRGVLLRVEAESEGVARSIWRDVTGPLGAELRLHLGAAHGLAEEAERAIAGVEKVIALLEPVRDWIARALGANLERHTELRRAFILLDLGLTVLVGLVADGCLAARSFEPIDVFDWMQWLRRHGASRTCLESPWVRGLYDGPFAYVRGDASRPSLSAAVAIRGQMRGFLGYKGAPMWQMDAGMGDTVFAPLYLVLAARGVRFHFFHRVRRLSFDASRTKLLGVTLGVQATVKGGGAYDPLFVLPYAPAAASGDVERHLRCWPSEPDYAQLEQGEALSARRVDLESSWADWHDVATVELVADADFDVVINGMSLAAWPDVAPELFEGTSETAARWRALRDHVTTVQTQCIQLWLTRTATELGRPGPQGFTGAYAQPFNTWADLTDLLRTERWAGEGAPRSVIYLCGPMRDAPVTPPYDAHGFPERERERTLQAGIDWLSANGGYPWPGQAPDDEPAALDPGVLFDPEGRQGWDRLRAQYVRANVEPTERYVLSPPGSTRYRMRAWESGVSNLLLAGDWLRTGLESGCVEAAVMGGLQASQRLCGHPSVIIGDGDDWTGSEEPVA